MIPLKIRLNNFLSYGATNETLDFRYFDLACLSGPNGAGKSSLLEAMIWVLWGKGRASDDEMIHQGEKEMWVEFEFMIDNQKYKVIRKRIKKRQSILELFLEKNDKYFPISEATYTQTQEKLSKILKISQQTFLNSAFLRQGRADEFTRKTPTERKAILGEILGLDIYDDLALRTKEKIKEKENIISGQRVILDQIKEKIEKEDEFLTNLKEIEKKIQEIKEKLKKTESEYLFWEKKFVFLEQKEKEKINLLSEKEEILNEIKQGKEKKEQLASEIDQFKKFIFQKEEIEKGYNLLQAVREEEKQWGEKLSLYNQLLEQKHQINQKIEEMRHQLEIEKKRLETLLGRFQENLALKENFLKEKALLEAELKVKKEIEEKIREVEKEKLTSLIIERETGLQQLRKEAEQIKEKISLLSKSEAHCPLCEQILNFQDRKQLLAKFQSQLQELRKEYSQIAEQIKQAQQNKQKIEREIELLEVKQQKMAEKESKLSFLVLKIEEINKESKEKEKIQTALVAISNKIKNQSYGQDLFKELNKIEDQIEKLGYSSQKHQEVKTKIERLLKYEELKEKLTQADFKIEKNKEAIKEIEATEKKLKEKLAKIEIENQKIEQQLKEKEKVLNQKKVLEQYLETIKSQKDELIAQQSYYKTLLEEIKRNKKEVEERLLEIKKAEEELEILREILEIVGKNGIPALIIKKALPEIEQEAQNLLARLTEGRMKVYLVTEKEKKTSKELKETLEIIVGDENGQREYSMFSGGEAFRIDFALRVALSKFLAKKAGVKLQMIVIDEGFGTQDSQGLNALVEAINSIKEDFKKILVITHLEELKYQFPVKINIYKDSQGSHIEMEG